MKKGILFRMKRITIIIFFLISLISFNSTAQLNELAGGNIGIGTTTALEGAKLTIKGSTGANWKLLALDGGTDDWFLGSFGGGGFFISKDNFNSGNSRFSIVDDKIGIGTNSPSYKLTINSINENHFRLDNGTESAFLKLLDDGNLNLWVHGEDDMIFTRGGGSGTESMRITSTGNIGIGTSSPDTKLDVIGNIQLSQTGGSKIGFGDFDGKIYYGLGLYGNDVRIVGFNAGNRHISFGFNDEFENWTPSMTIKNNGNIGIGTTDPLGFKLAVKGKIGAEEIEVKANYWSDFVFNPEYKLKSLEEVETFIKENNHLSDIPSEKEILDNGINLGEMDAKLLRKIEELTLYIIAQNKKIEQQNKEIKELKKQNGKIKTLEEKIEKIETVLN